MRFLRCALLVVFFAPIAQFASAQQTASSSQRDPQALAVLTQSLNTVGGATAISAIQDFTGTGTITCNWAGEPVPGSVTVRGKGLNEFRMDANVPGGTQSFILNDKAASLIPLNRPKIKLSVYSVMSAGSLSFPAARIANALTDSSISIGYLGSVTWNGSQVYRVHVAPPLDPALSLSAPLPELGEFDLYIDPASFQLLGFAEKVWWGNDLTHSYLHEIIFSNYTITHGLSVPFIITEKFGGQQTWSITLSSLTFNTVFPTLSSRCEPV